MNRTRTTATTPRPTRPGLRGHRCADGGYAAVTDVPPEWRGSTAALAGLRPFPTASAAPMIGVPLGPAPSGRTVCADPISWFERAHLIGNPSAFVLGRPGLGKSTLVRRGELLLIEDGECFGVRQGCPFSGGEHRAFPPRRQMRYHDSGNPDFGRNLGVQYQAIGAWVELSDPQPKKLQQP